MLSKWIAGFFSAVLASMGMGGGSILIIYLTLWEEMAQQQAQGINLLFFIPVAAIALFIHNKNSLVKWKTALPFILSGMVGVFLGSAVAHGIDAELLRKAFAVFLMIIGARELFQKTS